MSDVETSYAQFLFEKCIAKGETFVVFDRAADGVDVPTYLPEGSAGVVTLKFSGRYNMPMKWDDEKLVADLTFKGKTFTARVPWSAMWFVGNQGKLEPVLSLVEVPKSPNATAPVDLPVLEVLPPVFSTRRLDIN